jgi:hypothetical protein
VASVDGTGAVIVSGDGAGGTAYPELLDPKEVDCASERVLVWAGVDGEGLVGEDAVATVEDVGGADCVCVVVGVIAGGQGVKVPECHIELDEGNGAVER